MTAALSAGTIVEHAMGARRRSHNDTAQKKRCHSVLIVEDDPGIAKIHHKYISSVPSFTVCGIARGGREAWEMIGCLKPDVLLLDLELPEVNGLSLLRSLRQQTQSTEVVVVSGHSSPQVVRGCMQLGAVDYLVKPFWLNRLAQALSLVEARARTFNLGCRLEQGAIDRAKGIGATELSGGSGISPERLDRVRSVLAAAGQAMSAEQVAYIGKMSRVTARRYLEHLVCLGQCTVDSEAPGGPGRPSKFYRPWLSRPLGG
jgi:response regulator of citrate/malate metabolism